MKPLRLAVMVGLLSTITSTGVAVRAQGTAFTYQGRLSDVSGLVNGSYDGTFTLYAGATNGSAVVAGPVTNVAVAVSNGLFTTTVDFGRGFNGDPRWLEIGVQTNGGTNFVTLTPRQLVTPAPYAITAGNVTGVVSNSSVAGAYDNQVTFDNGGNHFTGVFSGDGSSLDNVDALTLDGLGAAFFWQTSGNYGTSPQNGNFIGTLDNQAFEIWVNDARGFRVEPPSSGIISTVVPKSKSGPVPKFITDSVPNIIGGGSANSVYQGSQGSVIAGGGSTSLAPNTIGANFGTIGGGQQNFIQSGADGSTIGGGYANAVQGGGYGFIGGGSGNTIQSDGSGPESTPASTLAGGNNNIINTDDAFIGGGLGNSIQGSSTGAGIVGGQNNGIQYASAASFIGGGEQNVIGGESGYAAIAGGSSNVISGAYAMIAGGWDNAATNNAFAAGSHAKAVNTGAFVWADSQDGDFSSTTNDEVAFRCAGGVIFASGESSVAWTPGSGSWSFTSDRNAKEHFQLVDAQSILEKVAQLPLTEWNYKGYGDRHVGPMAQDFHAAFPFNGNDKMLNSADEAGITLAAIQGLNQKLETEVKQKDAKIGELEKRLDELEQMVQAMAAKH